MKDIDIEGLNIKRNARHIYTLQEGEKWTVYKGSIIVIHPEREPKVVRMDGTVEVLKIRS